MHVSLKFFVELAQEIKSTYGTSTKVHWKRTWRVSSRCTITFSVYIYMCMTFIYIHRFSNSKELKWKNHPPNFRAKTSIKRLAQRTIITSSLHCALILQIIHALSLVFSLALIFLPNKISSSFFFNLCARFSSPICVLVNYFEQVQQFQFIIIDNNHWIKVVITILLVIGG